MPRTKPVRGVLSLGTASGQAWWAVTRPTGWAVAFCGRNSPDTGFFSLVLGAQSCSNCTAVELRAFSFLWGNSCCPTIPAPFAWQHQRWSMAELALSALPASLPCVCMAEIPGGGDRIALKHSIVLLPTPTALSKILPHNYSFSVSLHLNKVLLSGCICCCIQHT